MQIANEYLERAKDLICSEIFYDESIAKKCHVSYGWPSSKGIAAKNRTIGEAWQQSGKEAIFISPALFKQGNDVEVLAVLVHELIHIKIGTDKGHKGTFKSEMKEVGLEGKPTATVPGEELIQRLQDLKAFHDLPDCPDLALDKTLKKKQGTRLLKVVCGCGRIARQTKTEYEKGKMICSLCNTDYEIENGGNDSE